MKLEDFAKYVNTRRKHKIQYERLAEEFKTKGYEKFLLISTAEEFSIWGKVSEKIKEIQSKSIPIVVEEMFLPIKNQINENYN